MRKHFTVVAGAGVSCQPHVIRALLCPNRSRLVGIPAIGLDDSCIVFAYLGMAPSELCCTFACLGIARSGKESLKIRKEDKNSDPQLVKRDRCVIEDI